MKELLIVQDESFALTPAHLQRLAERPVHVEYVPVGSVSPARLSGVAALWGAPLPESLSAAPFLVWHHLPRPLVRRYTETRWYADPNVLLTKPVGVFGASAAEHVLSMVLRLCRGDDRFGSCFDRPRELSGATVAVLGLGDVGQAVAGVLKGLSSRVLGVRRNLLARLPQVEVFDLYDLHDVLSQADIVVNCLPVTNETIGVLDRRALAAMKKGALLVSVGDSAVVVFDDLFELLEGRHLAGGGLDAVGAEGLPPGHPMRALPQVFITQSAAGDSETVDERRFAQFERLLDRFLAGRRPTDTVDFYRGY